MNGMSREIADLIEEYEVPMNVVKGGKCNNIAEKLDC